MGDGSLRVFLTCLWALALVAPSDSEQYRDNQMMIILTEDNFEKTITDNQIALVNFYVPWCSHFKKLAHELIKASDWSRARNHSIVFGLLNAEEHNSITEWYKVYSFPTLLLFLNKTAIPYDGPRESESILNWVSTKVKTEPMIIESQNEIHALLEDYTAVLSVIGPDMQEMEVLRKFSKTLEKTGVVYTPRSHQRKPDPQSTSETSRITLYRRHAKECAFDAELLSEHSLFSFIQKYEHTPISNFQERHSLERVFNQEGSSVIFFTNNSRDSFIPRFAQLAQENQHQLKAFLVSPQDKYSRELREFLGVGLERPKRAIFMLITAPDQSTEAYRLMERIDGWNLQMFIKRWQNGRLDSSFANLTDEQIILDLNDPAVHERLALTNSTCCVFNFRGEECDRRKSCRMKLRKFDKFASRLFLIKRLEFCHLNFDRGYRFSKGDYYEHMRAPMPALSLTYRGTEHKAVLTDFDWKFDSLLLWLKAELAEDLAAALINSL